MWDTLLPIFTIPTIGFVIVLFLPFSSNEDKERGKVITLVFLILTFIESLRIWLKFDYLTTDFQFVSAIEWTRTTGLVFGVDGISLMFIILPQSNP